MTATNLRTMATDMSDTEKITIHVCSDAHAPDWLRQLNAQGAPGWLVFELMADDARARELEEHEADLADRLDGRCELCGEGWGGLVIDGGQAMCADCAGWDQWLSQAGFP